MSTEAKKDNKDYTIKEQGTGFLHKSVPNDKTKEGSPDYFGSMNLNGRMYDLGAWTKEGGTSGNSYLSLNLDFADMSTADKETHRKQLIKDFKADKKKQEESKKEFLLIEQTGTIHPETDAKKDNDYFGTCLIDGKKIWFDGFMTEIKGKAVLRLEVSDGMKSKEERAALSNDFL